MKPPKSVKVGPYDYLVTTDPATMLIATTLEASSLMGYTDPNNSRILLNASQTPRMMASTLLHEVLHAIFHCHSLNDLLRDKESETEEAFIARLEGPLFAVLRENSTLVAFLTQP